MIVELEYFSNAAAAGINVNVLSHLHCHERVISTLTRRSSNLDGDNLKINVRRKHASDRGVLVQVSPALIGIRAQ